LYRVPYWLDNGNYPRTCINVIGRVAPLQSSLFSH
jgi:hypothetical protein